MTIGETFEKLENKFNDSNLKGEFVFNESENIIIWEYQLIDDIDDENNLTDYEENDLFDVLSDDELLQEVYDHDIIKIETFLEKQGILDDLKLTDPEILNDIISFNIYY